MLKKKTITFGVCTALVLIFLCASVVAIFANSNLLVKTNVSVSYSAPTLDSAYVATNYWRMGDEEKTESLARTKVEDVQPSSSITTELTRDYNYVVYEFVMENASANAKYYFQVVYNDDTTADSNMYVKYCSSVGAPIEIEDILNQEIEEISEYYYWRGDTRLSNNVEAGAGQTVYAYAIVGVDDIWCDATFSGAFDCNISLEPFDDSEQISVKQKSYNVYVLEMGEMPQSYAGADDSLYTLSEEVYTESGVDYEVYTDENGDKFAKKDGKYYKFEPIVWEVRGYTYNRGLIGDYGTGQFGIKNTKNLVIVSEKILFNSVWNTTLSRVNYPNSTIYANLLEFYNSVLIEFEKTIENYDVTYNRVEQYIISSLADNGSYSASISQKIRLINTSMASSNNMKFGNTSSRKAYYTSWALGSESTTTYGKWWTRTNQYNNTDGEIFVANAVDVDGYFVATNINEVCGVRPVMVVSLP